jgi:arabinose-5-phosphate isomerase
MNELINAKKCIELQIDAIVKMKDKIDQSLINAIDLIFESKGRVIISGMGKSGIIASKIAATMSSTGTPAYFVHPGEAFHGDLGMIKSKDVVILISQSGETEEILKIIPYLLQKKIKIIALTGRSDSTLAKYSDVMVDVGVDKEACNINLAPTSSTTCALIIGDTIAVLLSVRRDFKSEDFAVFHPGGSLGLRLLTNVGDVMQRSDLPFCEIQENFRSIVQKMTSSSLGVAIVKSTRLEGIITDGDIRRAFERYDDCRHLTAKDIMTLDPVTVAADYKVNEAEKLMLEKKVNQLLVLSGESIVGVFSAKMLKDGLHNPRQIAS